MQVNYLLTKVSGKKAADRASSLMSSVMTFYCAAHFVWDGKHKATNQDLRKKLALAEALPSLEKCLRGKLTSSAPHETTHFVLVQQFNTCYVFLQR